MFILCSGLLLLAVSVTAHELVYATCGIDKFLLAGEERVRGTGDFELNQRISHAIHFDCLLCGYSRAGNEDLFSFY